ncbi:MAG TPA: VWA domain-containing protein [Thermoplasmata archaeon]|nr:VWA domain-containing protein [Thermoplasmata archaeon]
MREKVRRRKIGNTILFVVDASGSMGANQRMKAVKTAVLSLLLNAYQQRDRVGLIAFRGRDAELLLPPTSSVELAEKYLREIPTGGKTPLPHGLMKAYEVFKTELLRNPDISPLLVLLSDGRANMPLWGNPLEDVEKIGELLRKQRVKSIILDCEHGLVSLGLAKTISQILDAQYILLEEIKTTNILKSIKCSINTSFNP